MWNKFQWNLNEDAVIFIQENAFEMLLYKTAKSQPFCTGFNSSLPSTAYMSRVSGLRQH